MNNSFTFHVSQPMWHMDTWAHIGWIILGCAVIIGALIATYLGFSNSRRRNRWENAATNAQMALGVISVMALLMAVAFTLTTHLGGHAGQITNTQPLSDYQQRALADSINRHFTGPYHLVTNVNDIAANNLIFTDYNGHAKSCVLHIINTQTTRHNYEADITAQILCDDMTHVLAPTA